MQSKRFFWFDAKHLANSFQLYLCWVLVFSSAPITLNTTSRSNQFSFRQLNTSFSDSIGICIDWLPRLWLFKYIEQSRRLCISLWLLAFCFDLPLQKFKFTLSNNTLASTVAKK